MSKQTKLKQQSTKRVPSPKRRREPLPVSISVKHHLLVGAEGTATDLTVAELEAASRSVEKKRFLLDYSTSQAEASLRSSFDRIDRSDQKDRGKDRTYNRKGRSGERKMESIDLGIDSRFVRVPNAVADQLARQLSPAEEKVFDQVWRLTVGFNREVWRGKIADLMLRTGYSSRATVTKAIAGLSALGLIAVEGRDTNPRGRSFRIADRAQLLDYASASNSNDQSIKKAATSQANSSRLVERRASLISSDLPENRSGTPDSRSTGRVLKNRVERNDDDSGYKPSSSSDDDDEISSQVRLIYQDLTGTVWSKRDEAAYKDLAKVPLPFIILGICYSISRAADHRIGSLKYCLPSIKEHYELMRGFANKDLLEIAYRHLVRVKEAQRTGKWSVN